MARDMDEGSGRPFIEFARPDQRIVVVEAFEASGSGEELHRDRVPNFLAG